MLLLLLCGHFIYFRFILRIQYSYSVVSCQPSVITYQSTIRLCKIKVMRHLRQLFHLHSYQPTPSFHLSLSSSSLAFFPGEETEPAVGLIIVNTHRLDNIIESCVAALDQVTICIARGSHLRAVTASPASDSSETVQSHAVHLRRSHQWQQICHLVRRMFSVIVLLCCITVLETVLLLLASQLPRFRLSYLLDNLFENLSHRLLSLYNGNQNNDNNNKHDTLSSTIPILLKPALVL